MNKQAYYTKEITDTQRLCCLMMYILYYSHIICNRWDYFSVNGRIDEKNKEGKSTYCLECKVADMIFLAMCLLCSNGKLAVLLITTSLHPLDSMPCYGTPLIRSLNMHILTISDFNVFYRRPPGIFTFHMLCKDSKDWRIKVFLYVYISSLLYPLFPKGFS